MSERSTALLWDRNAPHDARIELFGGRGTVRVWPLVATPKSPFAAVLACELEPGASVGVHVQQQFPELVIAVSGHGSVSVDGAACAFVAGGVVELGLGQTLSICNGSHDEPLRYLIIKARG